MAAAVFANRVPAPGATDAAANGGIDVVFGNAMNPSSVEAAFVVEAYDGTTVSGTVTATATTLRFDPDQPFVSGYSYRATLGAGAQFASGASVPPANWSFLVRDERGWVAPAMAGTTDLSAEIVLRRSNAGETVVGWKDGGGTQIARSALGSATFDPAQPVTMTAAAELTELSVGPSGNALLLATHLNDVHWALVEPGGAVTTGAPLAEIRTDPVSGRNATAGLISILPTPSGGAHCFWFTGVTPAFLHDPPIGWNALGTFDPASASWMPIQRTERGLPRSTWHAAGHDDTPYLLRFDGGAQAAVGPAPFVMGPWTNIATAADETSPARVAVGDDGVAWFAWSGEATAEFAQGAVWVVRYEPSAGFSAPEAAAPIPEQDAWSLVAGGDVCIVRDNFEGLTWMRRGGPLEGGAWQAETMPLGVRLSGTSFASAAFTDSANRTTLIWNDIYGFSPPKVRLRIHYPGIGWIDHGPVPDTPVEKVAFDAEGRIAFVGRNAANELIVQRFQ